MRTRKCQLCGKLFRPDGQYVLYCPECRPKARAATVIRDRTCAICGAVFPGGPAAKYCPSCKIEPKRKRDREHKRRGTLRPIGSADICEKCGKEYTVTGGKQKYCPACSAEAIAETVRGKKRVYSAENHDVLRQKYKEKRLKSFPCAVCGKLLTPEEIAAGNCACVEHRREYAYRTQAYSDIKRGRRKGEPMHQMENNGIPKSGVPGVTWNKGRKKWQAAYKGKYIGLFSSVEDAEQAIDAKRAAAEAADAKSTGAEPAKRGRTYQWHRWHLRSPDGEIFTFANLSAFTREHPEWFPNPKSAAANFAQIRNGTTSAKQYKGWRVVISDEPPEELETWRLQSPDGEQHECVSLRAFVHEHPEWFPNADSARSSFLSRANGTYKGWAVLNRPGQRKPEQPRVEHTEGSVFNGLYSITDAADAWGVTPQELRAGIASGRLRRGVDCELFGRTWVVAADAMRREFGELKESGGQS